jgi:hypothetical protein
VEMEAKSSSSIQILRPPANEPRAGSSSSSSSNSSSSSQRRSKKNHQLIKGSEVFRPELLSLLWLSVMMIASIYFTCGYPINVGPVYR